MDVPVDETIRLLLNLGFTSYESKLLECLYNNGPTKADSLSKMSQVPLTRAYEALDSLIAKNFISSSNTRPKIYTAINPQQSIAGLMQDAKRKQEEKFNRLVEEGNSLLDRIHPLYLEQHTQITPEALLSQFASLEEAEHYTIKLIENAQNEIKIFTHVFNWFHTVKDVLKASIARGCEVKVIMQTDDEDQTSQEELISLGIKLKVVPSKGILSRGTIVDQQSILFVIWANEGGIKSRQKRIYHPHASTNAGVVDVFNSYFNYHWYQE